MGKYREVVLSKEEDGTWELRTLLNGWGKIGLRKLKGEMSGLPKYKGVNLSEAVEMLDVWQGFVDDQDARLNAMGKKASGKGK